MSLCFYDLEMRYYFNNYLYITLVLFFFLLCFEVFNIYLYDDNLTLSLWQMKYLYNGCMTILHFFLRI